MHHLKTLILLFFFCLIFISNLVFIPSFFFLQEEAEIPIHFYQKISEVKNIQEFINMTKINVAFETAGKYGRQTVIDMLQLVKISGAIGKRENHQQIWGKADHPSLDNPQKKNQKTHLGDPKIDQVDGVGYPKTFETKSS